MKIPFTLCMILCLNQQVSLFAMAEPSTRRTTNPVVRVLKIVNEEGKLIRGTEHACTEFKYTDGHEAIFTSHFFLGSRGAFTLWLDDRAFWCSNEQQRLVELQDEDGHALLDKNGNVRKISLPLTHLIPLISSLKPNMHYWINIRITKDSIETCAIS